MRDVVRKAIETVEQWCQNTRTPYNVLCGENDVQGFALFKRSNEIGDLVPVLESIRGLCYELQRVRGGTILALSVEALSESEMSQLINLSESTFFSSKIEHVFESELPKATVQEEDVAAKLMASDSKLSEDQYHTPCGNMTLAQSNHPAAIDRKNIGNFGGRRKKRKESMKESFWNRIDAIFEQAATAPAPEAPPPLPTFGYVRPKSLDAILENLDGMGAEFQPNQLFQAFAAALQSLGQAMGVGPLQDQLKKRGIKWKTSDDGQAIIFFVLNGTTHAEQPIGMISADTLGKPNEFQEQLTSIIDYVRGEAPGTERARREQVRDTEKQIRDIANQHAPQAPKPGAGGAPPAGAAQTGAPAPAGQAPAGQAPGAGAPAPAAAAAPAAGAGPAAPKKPQIPLKPNNAPVVK